MKNFTLFLLAFFPFISLAQQSDTASRSSSATLHIYYPAEGARGSFKLYMDDSLVWKAQYNSRKDVKIYKEGKTLFWTPPQNQYSVIIDVKFGEEYYLQCGLQKGELILMPVLKQVSAYTGSMGTNQIKRDYDTLKTRKERRMAQDTFLRRNTIYAQVGGESFLYSLSYDYLLRVNKKTMHSVSVGIELFDWYRYPKGYPRDLCINGIVPFSYNFLFGRKSSHLELGLGSAIHFYRYMEVWGSANSDVSRYRSCDIYFSPKIGWRYQPKRGGFFFKATFSPILNVLNYYSGRKYATAPEWNTPSTITFFETIGPWDSPIIPWAGLSLGYTFNFKKKK